MTIADAHYAKELWASGSYTHAGEQFTVDGFRSRVARCCVRGFHYTAPHVVAQFATIQGFHVPPAQYCFRCEHAACLSAGTPVLLQVVIYVLM